jgi:hypothetical protein
LASSGTGSTSGTLIPVAALRYRGARGGVIHKHRAMLGLPWTPWRAVRAVILAALGVVGVGAALPGLARGYARGFERALAWLGLPDAVGVYGVSVGSLMTIPVPYPLLDAPWPATWNWVVIGSVTLAAFVVSFLLPVRLLPLRYFLRFVALVQAVALLWFWFSAPPFRYPLPDYLAGFLTVGMAVLVLVPVVLGFVFFVFDHALWRQALLALVVLGHLAVLLPLQVLVHGALSHYLSVLVQPTMFFLFGLLLQVLVFVALYGWAMSWPGEEIPQTGPGGGAP